MVALDQTKLLMTGVVLGFVLAVLLFRPEIFPQEEGLTVFDPIEDHAGKHKDEKPALSQIEPIEGQRELERREAGQGECRRELDECRPEVEAREAALDQREGRLEKWASELDKWESELYALDADLDQREAALDERETRLREEEDRADARTAALRRKMVRLAEQQEELRRLRRLSLVAAILAGLLAVPSILVLVALVQRTRYNKLPQQGSTRQGHQKRTIPGRRQTRA